MALPLRLPKEQMENRWKSQLDPLLSNPLNNVLILKDVLLKTGSNTVNHRLGQVQQGWFLVDKQGPGDIYRSAPFNNLTLILTSDADVTVSIGVY